MLLGDGERQQWRVAEPVADICDISSDLISVSHALKPFGRADRTRFAKHRRIISLRRSAGDLLGRLGHRFERLGRGGEGATMSPTVYQKRAGNQTTAPRRALGRSDQNMMNNRSPRGWQGGQRRNRESNHVQKPSRKSHESPEESA